ncbi:cell division protein FtsQ/DivIB [Paenibacillus crassostreae]|uniref:Cell division protein DivIB n=1 Tax=Paenibacillus crassostreae TaxID=1763538 RepID=A0A167C415_9BACL|nr:FtsQ-type POTRA domain-containing protein [Paenibacillus crassostreae]AOZ91672.1 cell division protein DivIB [Paenibacillus crassostreae]OAB72755.1 cell division protein DivIB [Paenibacillus crassostreae]
MSKLIIPALKPNKPKRMKTSRKIILILMLLFVVILAVLFFRSPLSRISEIQFKGNTFTTREQMLLTGEFNVDGQFFGVSTSTLKQKLMTINSVQHVTVNKNFPGQIIIQIQEYPTVAYEVGERGTLMAILSSGAMIPVDSIGIAVEKPILTKWDPSDPFKLQLTQALGEIPNQLISDISEIIPSPTVSFPDRIKLYTRSKFEVITAVSILKDKVEYLNQVIETEEPGLITMLEADSYVPFLPLNSELENGESTSNN